MAKDQTHQQHSGRGDNISGNKNVHIYGEKKYPKYLTSKFPKFSIENFVGREITLQTLHQKLEANQKTLLLNGLGGIGKTSVAQMYCHLHEKDYDHLVWLNQTDGFENACLNALGLQKNLGITLTNNPKQTIQQIFYILNNIDGNKLMVLDNADSSLQIYIDSLPSTWKILVTSREKMDDRFTEYRLDTLEFTEALKLFEKHYQKAQIDEELFESLCVEIGYHTLTLELLAKTLQESFELHSIEDLLEYLYTNRLDAEELQESIFTNHSKAEVEIYAHLLQAFNLADLDEDEKWLLLQFAVLPPIPHEAKEFLDWIQVENTRIYGKLLKKLHKKGWLERKGNAFLMHRMVQVLVRGQMEMSYDSCKGVIDSFKDLLSFNQDKDNPIDKFQWIEYGVNLLNHIDEEHSQISWLSNWVGRGLEERGNYFDAIIYIKKAMNIAILLNDSDVINANKNDLANVYSKLGRYEEAVELLECVLKSDLNKYGKNHKNVALRKSNLGFSYAELGRVDEAILVLKEALQSDINNFGANHPTVTNDRCNLGLVYRYAKEYEKAAELLEMALIANQNEFGEHHPIVASNQSNLASVYNEIGKHVEAERLLKIALESGLRNFGENHPNVAIRFNNLALVYMQTEKYEDAKSHYENAYSIFFRNFGEKHPHTRKVKQHLEKVKMIIKNQ